MSGEDEMVKKFENVLIELKKPYLDRTDKIGDDNTDYNIQNLTEVTTKIQSIMSKMYTIIIGIIKNGGRVIQNAPLDSYTLYQAFQKDNIFTELQNNPDLKEPFESSLKVFLIDYPSTRTVKHTYTLKKHGIIPDNTIPVNDE